MTVNTELETEFAGLYGPFFTYMEFACKCAICKERRQFDGGGWFRKPEFKAFMINLISLRDVLGFPFQINSGYRCPEHPEEAKKENGPGPHFHGAADVGVTFERSYKLIRAAMKRDMGVGPVQHGKIAGRLVHVDNQGPRFWTYPRTNT